MYSQKSLFFGFPTEHDPYFLLTFHIPDLLVTLHCLRHQKTTDQVRVLV